MRKLAATVHVHADDGTSHVFGPGDLVPAWAAARIPNPKAWDSPAEPEPQSVPVVVAVVEGSTATTPPRTGPGSSRAAWRAYAQALGVDIGGDASRDEIIAAVDAHKP